jgi:hypothetical protein
MLRLPFRPIRRTTIAAGAAMLLAAVGVTLATQTAAQAATQGPCDIYASGGTPCVAAHSTTRALYASYNGSLYQVKRASDSTTKDIGVVSAGGIANSAAQDSFCASTSCVITKIYDQSGRGNTLTQAPAGGAAGGPDNLANAAAAPVALNGSKVYGVLVSPGTGYRDDSTSGIATGDAAEGEYAVFDGTHYDNGCCFDYGNAETSNNDTGNGHMEAIYFGTENAWGFGSGNGPWVMADLENGLFSGVNQHLNSGDPTVSNRFLTAIVKGEPNQWAIRGGNGQSGSLSTFYSGVRPNVSGYNPMHKEGAIILGIGGDNSKSSSGTFYEGVLTSGYPSDATENSVQANIVAAKYATVSTPFTAGTRVSLQATTSGYTGYYLSHSGSNVAIAQVTSSSSASAKSAATFIVQAGLGDSSCVSFESADTSGSYLRHSNFHLYLNANDGSALFAQDATFCPVAGNSGSNWSFLSINYSSKYIRHYNLNGYIASNGGSNAWDATASWTADTTWVKASPWG